MDHEEIREALESLAEMAHRARTPPPDAHNAVAAEIHTIRSFLAGVKAADGLPAAEIEQWQARVQAMTEQMSEAWTAARRASDTATAAAQLGSQAAANARGHLQHLLHRIESEREMRRAGHDVDTAARPEAEGAVAGFLHAGLIDREEYADWSRLFREAGSEEPPDATRHVVRVQAPRRAQLPRSAQVTRAVGSEPPQMPYRRRSAFTAERLSGVLILGLEAEPWRLQTIELFEDGLIVNLWRRRDEDERGGGARLPRVTVTDDVGTVYTAGGSNGQSNGGNRVWRGSFGPALVPEATELVVSLETYEFRITLKPEA